MHARTANHRLPPLGLVGIFLAFAAVIALIPYTVTTGLIRLRRLRSRAKTFECPKCNEVIGTDALKLPEGIRHQVLHEVKVTKDFDRWHRAQSVHAVCAKCGTLFTFDKKTREFGVVGLGPPGVRA
jgi:predicted RNA-binding Zn-ribbon protein involved in translation (DUF1610 family)